MRDYKRKQAERSHLRLTRDESGRLRSLHGDKSIGEIWAEQKRIRLKDAIEEEKQRSQKKVLRRKKFLALAKKVKTVPELKNLAADRKKLFGAAHSVGVSFVKRVKRLKKRQAVFVGLGLIFVLSTAGFMTYGGQKNGGGSGSHNTKDVLAASDKGPQFETVLPTGKSIDDLGGWGRVSPPEKDPVYAFVDTIGSITVRVSEQPLPSGFKDDIASSVRDVAKQFTANDTIQVDGNTIYVGTSEKGPQSLILSLKGLLILIRSDDKVSNDQWAAYVASLK